MLEHFFLSFSLNWQVVRLFTPSISTFIITDFKFIEDDRVNTLRSDLISTVKNRLVLVSFFSSESYSYAVN